MPLFTDGVVADAALLNALNAYVLKAADESVSSSTTLQNDNHLAYVLPATGTYAFDLHLWTDSAVTNTGNIKIGFTFPTGTLHFKGLGGALGMTNTFVSDGLWAGVLSATSGTSTLPFGVAATVAGYTGGITISGLFIATATGTLQMQWAQNASSGNATTVKAGSHMLVKRVA